MIGALIKIFFKSLFATILVMLLVYFFIGGGNTLYIIGIILFIMVLIGAYIQDKEKTTCPRCKEPFVWYEEKEGTETLSEDYISQDVKDSEGVYRRKAYRIGKERDYYRSTCKECGYTTTRTEVGSFKREV